MSLQNINTYTYSPGFQLGQYHNAVLCISGNAQSLYLDGTLIATKTGTTNVLANYSTINQILIGCAGDKSSGFSGYLDDFRMYNYTLNPAQVSNLYINRNIIAYYPFDNSLNNQTPNYATLTYDASLVGISATITTSTYQNGNGSLQLTNTNTAGSVKSYVTSSSGFTTSSTNGLSISLWFKTTGVSGSRMRLFDLCTSAGIQGISVDIDGTNQIFAGNGLYNQSVTPVQTAVNTVKKYTNTYLWLSAASSSNFTLNGNTITQWNGSNGGIGTTSITATLYTNPYYVSADPNTFNFTSSNYYSTGNSETIFAVVSFPNFTSSSAIYLISAPSGNDSRYININYPSSNCVSILKTDTATGIIGTLNGVTFAANTKYLISISTIYNNSLTSTIIRVNGVSLTLSGSPSFAQSNSAKNTNFGYVYAPYASNTTPIYYYEVIGMYNSGLMSIADIKIIETDLYNKWGFAYTL